MLKSPTEPFVHKRVRDKYKDRLNFKDKSESHNMTLTPETNFQLQTSDTRHFNRTAVHKKYNIIT